MERIRGFISRIIDWFNNLDSKQRLFAAIVAVIIMALLTFGISKIRIGGNQINYKEINIESIKNLNVSNSKDLYINCDILTKRLVETYYGKYKISNLDVYLNDYYEHCKLEEYNISKSKFNKKFATIIDELKSEKNADSSEIDTFYPIIDKIYVYDETKQMYFIKFSTKEDHVLGIQFKDKYFYIFYLE